MDNFKPKSLTGASGSGLQAISSEYPGDSAHMLLKRTLPYEVSSPSVEIANRPEARGERREGERGESGYRGPPEGLRPGAGKKRGPCALPPEKPADLRTSA